MDKTKHRIDENRLQELLSGLVGIYSPSGKEENIQQHLFEYMKRCMLPVEKQQVDDNRYNLVVWPEDGSVQVVLVGHVDTVPAPELDSYEPTLEDDTLYGLGTADMKGGCAAMIEAMRVCYEQREGPPQAALVLVVGEEESGDGMEMFLEHYHCPWALVGEPTEMQPCLGHYGYLEIQLNTFGQRRHASLAGREHNAIYAMLNALMKLTEHVESSRGDIICNIRDVKSSEAGFAVPDLCTAWVDLHVPPHSRIGDIAVEIEELLMPHLTGQGSEPPPLSFSTIDAGYELPDRGEIPQKLRRVFSQRGRSWMPGAFRSHSDANQLWASGVKPVILGPGQLAMAHTAHESVALSEVAAAAGIYLDFLMTL